MCKGKWHMKVLLLGGTGAIGKPLSFLMAEKGYEVFITTRVKRNSDRDNIHFLIGDAQDYSFIKQVLSDNSYDVIIDFMIYSMSSFEERITKLLESTDHYVYFSSSRVFAENNGAINEYSDRLFDVCTDADYLKTQEYALIKAKQENILFEHNKKNWTIIRPYITYFSERLQLGAMEKEHWLYRAINGRTIVFSEDIANKYTTLTFGLDVAYGILSVVSNGGVKDGVINCVSNYSMKWSEVLEIYINAIEKITGRRPKVLLTNSSLGMTNILKNAYQVKYDRLYNRIFDNSRSQELLDKNYITIEEGIYESLKEFINSNAPFKDINWCLEGYYDRLTKERVPLKEFPSWKKMIKYYLSRYFNVMI